jgi:hypothetical protein
VLIHELPPMGPVEPAPEEVCRSLSESTRGSTLLAASDEWGPLVVELEVPVMLLEPTPVCLSLSESMRGSALLARFEE